MNKEEALFILGSEEDAQEQYEGFLFEHKQFLISRPPFSKVYQTRVDAIKRLNEAAEALGILELKREDIPGIVVFDGTVLETFSTYFDLRNRLFHNINRCNSGSELIELMSVYLKLYRSYAQAWRIDEGFSKEGITVSKEPDPMILMNAIKSSGKGMELSFSDIKSGNADPFVIQEAKRLTLWLKLENEHGELR